MEFVITALIAFVIGIAIGHDHMHKHAEKNILASMQLSCVLISRYISSRTGDPPDYHEGNVSLLIAKASVEASAKN